MLRATRQAMQPVKLAALALPKLIARPNADL
jgi:hypothetical protein